MKEDKHLRFRRLAEKRTNNVIKDLRILGNCSNRSNYYYTKEEIEKIFSAISNELRNAKSRFTFKDNSRKKNFKL